MMFLELPFIYSLCFSEDGRMYWFYDLPVWLSGILVMVVFAAAGTLGLFPTRKRVRALHRVDHSHNDIVGFYLAAITVLYGVTVGLGQLAPGPRIPTWRQKSNKKRSPSEACIGASEATQNLSVASCTHVEI
jgi:hypothetical protein